MATETLPAAPPAEPTTPIKPSEALRLGRLMRPRRIEGRGFDGEDGACAIGAMAIGGYLYRPDARGDFDCPVNEVHWHFWRRPCPYSYGDAVVMSVHLNDDHHWSDDQIVAWLESLGL